MPSEQKQAKAPPFWLPYISVKSADAIVKKAKAAGGKICMGPMDVMDQGRMAMIQDPTGASFAVWEARKHPGAGLDGTPGTVCWHDLSTPKTGAAGKFYTKVFGWTLSGEKYDGNTYHLFKLGKDGVGGMWPGPMKKLPTSWVTYFQVANCAKTVAEVKRLGGHVLMGATLVPKMCRFAILTDPQRAAFGVLEPLT
jgi:predicted enzyme related to lactoylglutathione lyase